MSLKIYNTLNREKQLFVPIEPGKVKMYVCGPTVYDYIHIGNARPAIFFDVVRRYLSFLGYEVQYVVNFTDVDDKLIRKSEQTGESVENISNTFIEAYHRDIAALRIEPATLNPRVTDHIDEIVAFIAELIAKGHAYESGGDVYFETATFAPYGKLSHQNVQELQAGARIEVDERKRSANDFVLWKAAKPGEVEWDSPWGKGRPGWHIECSAMARQYLGTTLDIHGGGHDLQFPHHECEVAQSECANGTQLANYWMHNGYIQINNEKMSKSLGNGINVHTLLENVKLETVRFFFLSTHYRNPLQFSDDGLEQAANGLDRLHNGIANLEYRLATAGDGDVEQAVAEAVERCKAKFVDKMNDDFNTADAITALFDLISESNAYLTQASVNKATVTLLLETFQEWDRVLGILPANASEDLLDDEVDQLIQERTEARKAKNWARADEIRDLLTEKGIVLEDTPQGLRWRRK